MFAPPTERQVLAVRERLGLNNRQRFIAFLGTLEPRKNIPALIRGWVAACHGRPDAPALVIAGGSGWDDEVNSAIAAVPAGLKLIRPGYLPIEELSGLLGGAAIVAYPSLAEGFGLPVLEAMSCGAPVLTTRRLSLPEVGGDAVAYTETDDASIADALGQLLDDPARRAVLAAAGPERAAGFTWDACAAAHVTAYERAADLPRRRAARDRGAGGRRRHGHLLARRVADDFLDSLRTATSAPLDIVLADNGSTDGSVEAAEQRPDVRLRADRRQPRLRTGGQRRGARDHRRVRRRRQPGHRLVTRLARRPARGGPPLADGRVVRPADPYARRAPSTRRHARCRRSAGASGTRCAVGGGRPIRGPRPTGPSARHRGSGPRAGCPDRAC